MVGDPLRNANSTIRRHGSVLRVASQNARIGDAISGFERFHVTTDVADDSASFLAIHERQWRGITSFAKINVNEIDACSGDFYHHLIGFRLGDGDVHERKGFGSSGLLHLDSLHRAAPRPVV
jgi:hypothetical protein